MFHQRPLTVVACSRRRESIINHSFIEKDEQLYEDEFTSCNTAAAASGNANAMYTRVAGNYVGTLFPLRQNFLILYKICASLKFNPISMQVTMNKAKITVCHTQLNLKV